MIYVCCFIISTFFIWVGTRHCNRRRMEDGTWVNVKLKLFPVMLGILIPVFLATFRATCVGSDVEFYVVPYFNSALKSANFSEYMFIIGGNQNDLAYCLINYVLSRFTDNIGWLFFVVELIIIVFIFAGAWQLRGKAYVWLNMLFFYLIFYNITLSTLRQSCAIAIAFYAISFVINKKFTKNSIVKACIMIGAASLFHKTVVVSVLMLLLMYMVCKNKIKIRKFLIITGLLIVSLDIFSEQFLGLVTFAASHINVKYTDELFFSTTNSGASGYLSVIAVSIVVFIIQWMLLKRRKDVYWQYVDKALLMLEFIYILVMLILSSYEFMPRMMYYIQILWSTSLAQGWCIVGKSRNNRIVVNSLLILFVGFYWWYFFINGAVHGTYPYILR